MRRRIESGPRIGYQFIYPGCGYGGDLKLMGTKETVLAGSDAMVICPVWQNFRAPYFVLIKNEINEATNFDGRNLLEPTRLSKKGFNFYSIGHALTVFGNESETKK